MKRLLLFGLVFLLAHDVRAQAAPDHPLQKLAADFWKWRAEFGPFSGDDVNRIERPGGVRDWSQSAIEKRRADLGGFEARWKQIDAKAWPIPQQVDYRLIGSTLARVHWELDVSPRWQRDPNFYVEQTLTPVTEALTVPGPFDEARSREVLTRLRNIPAILESAKANLKNPPAPFAKVAAQALDGIRASLQKMATSLQPVTTLKAEELNESTAQAATALEEFRARLLQQLPLLPAETALGREAYLFFLKNVALMPFSPEEILAMGGQEWNRAVAFEAYEKNRNKDVPPLPVAKDLDAWIKATAAKEAEIRKFLETQNLLTVPDSMPHYTFRAMPAYLQALSFTELDDFTSPSRLTEDCIRYVNAPSLKAGYFLRATAQDPRPLTVHEGIPGHYFQLFLSWHHEDPIRRHYYDSGVNEGIGFYAEEMMLQAGLFDDSPHSREIIYNFMRLRALRVEVDVRLALGEFTLEQAAKYLEEKVPMDPETAHQEATAFSTGSGQALTYQIGKLQILQLLAETRMQQGDKFNLRAFHDFVWKNGNVPLSLQRWELLGNADAVPR